jgi:hypothetical protein
LLNREKCVFAEPVVDFLGHQVSQAGITPLQSRVEAVRNFPKPVNNKQLMSFLGMLNFYRTIFAQGCPGVEAIDGRVAGWSSGGGGGDMVRGDE